MGITEAAIRNNRVTIVVVVALLLAGLSAYFSMPKQMDPGFTIRTAQIVTLFPGASPERVEQLVTDIIERKVQEVPELDMVSSVSRSGVSIIAVNIREEFSDMQPIWDDLRRKVASIGASLPDGVIGPNVNDELGDTYPMIYTMTADGYSYREMKEMADLIRDQLLRLDSVAKVEILGAQEERIFVEYNNARLAQVGLSPGALQSILSARNIIMPGGQVDVAPETISLEPSGNFGSVEDLRHTQIPLPGGQMTYLGDITNVFRDYVDPMDQSVSANGVRALGFAVSMSDGGNLIELGGRVQAFFESLPRDYPHGVDFQVAYFQPDDVNAKVDSFVSNVLQAIGIVLVVMLLALGFRTGMVVAALVPTAIIVTLWVMSLIGETINQVSLAALIIALGLLVDNAIVISESVLVRMQRGEAAVSAAIKTCAELRGSLLISSLTTAAAFLPIYLAESAVGEYAGALFVVVSITLLVSWSLAITMTPLLCVMFLKVKPLKEQEGGEGAAAATTVADQASSGFRDRYGAAVRAVMRRRWLSLALVVLAFVGSLQLWQFVPEIFFPAKEDAFFMAEFSMPSGTSIERTQEVVDGISAFIESDLRAAADGSEPGVTGWTSFVGTTPPPFVLGYTPSPSQSGFSEFMIQTSDGVVVNSLMTRLRRYAVTSYPDVTTDVRRLGNGPGGGTPVQVRISGPDVDRVFELVEGVSERLTSIRGTRNVRDNWGARVKKLRVNIDDERARRAGLSNVDVALSLQTFLSGFETTRFREDDQSIPIVLRSIADNRRDVDRLETLAVFPSGSARSVPLTQVADIELEFQPAEVLRRDRYRTVTVLSDIDTETNVTAFAIVDELRPWLEEQSEGWPPGYRFEIGGEVESSGEANASIGAKMPIAGLIILMLLVLQFNSMRKTAIVVSTIVLALIGVVIGLVVMRSSFGFFTLLGVVSLAGIVINNAIVLIDRIDLEIRDNGLAPAEAIVRAGQERIRPILLTTATTVASLIPLYLGGGAMWEPMAVAIMFGLVFATALTLGVVPLLYAIFFRVDVSEPPPAPLESDPEGPALATEVDV